MKSQEADDNLESRGGGPGGAPDKTPTLVTQTPTPPSLCKLSCCLVNFGLQQMFLNVRGLPSSPQPRVI
ncbi:hypothetical protein E2C01_025074 [Portunus trituberculatus]|uniref:Uncharacterized protein n=1 Tax=Portunus trituberculatus TaxID=210409 RepID=A0A5B7EEQ9_PORTR|nr:hypothetical protein [Portunus trituberculatus]